MFVQRGIASHDKKWIQREQERELARVLGPASVTKKTSRKERDQLLDRLYGREYRKQQKELKQQQQRYSLDRERMLRNGWKALGRDAPLQESNVITSVSPTTLSKRSKEELSDRLHHSEVLSRDLSWIAEEQNRHESILYTGHPDCMQARYEARYGVLSGGSPQPPGVSSMVYVGRNSSSRSRYSTGYSSDSFCSGSRVAREAHTTNSSQEYRNDAIEADEREDTTDPVEEAEVQAESESRAGVQVEAEAIEETEQPPAEAAVDMVAQAEKALESLERKGGGDQAEQDAKSGVVSTSRASVSSLSITSLTRTTARTAAKHGSPGPSPRSPMSPGTLLSRTVSPTSATSSTHVNTFAEHIDLGTTYGATPLATTHDTLLPIEMAPSTYPPTEGASERIDHIELGTTYCDTSSEY